MGALWPPSAMRITLPYDRSQFVKGTVHADTEDPDKFTLQTTEELDRLVAFCEDKRELQTGRTPDGMVHVAEIPVTVYEKAVMEGWDNPDGWREWLNKPENAIFRTWRGRV